MNKNLESRRILKGNQTWFGGDVSIEDAHFPLRDFSRPHPNQGKTREELMERCRRETAKGGVCPHGKWCRERKACPDSGFCGKEPDMKEVRASIRAWNKAVNKPVRTGGKNNRGNKWVLQ